MLFADEDDDVVLPDAAEKFDELLTRWPHVHTFSSTSIISKHKYFQNMYFIDMSIQNCMFTMCVYLH